MSLPTLDNDDHSNNHLFNKLQAIPNLVGVYSYLNFNKGGIAQKILHEVKYKGQEELGRRVGEWFGYHMADKLKTKGIDMIVPIPLYSAKRRRRGYNQSDLIAAGLSNSLDIVWDKNVLIRTKHTSTQTKKGKTERWVNVENIFDIKSNLDIKNMHILLVDDVITTGATVESASQVLSENGIGKISVACIASGR